MEIVSPSFRNVRTYDADLPFIPARAPRTRKPAQDAAPAEVVFDKAEVAETRSTLRKRRDEMKLELKEAEQAAKEAASKQDADRARHRAGQLEARLERLQQAIAERKEELDADDGD